jgi:F-type H+-transporting ATPase subunit alpha
VNTLGQPLDGKGAIQTTHFMPVERVAPGVVDRTPVKEPLQTGIKAIDAMIPIGRGQRELIIGDRQTGKTAIALDTIINQKGQGSSAFTSPSARSIDGVAGRQDARGGRSDGIHHRRLLRRVVAGPFAVPGALRRMRDGGVLPVQRHRRQPASKTNPGRAVLCIYDDLSKHAVAYREVSLLLRRPPAVRPTRATCSTCTRACSSGRRN